MKANRIHRFGPPEVIEFEDVAIPSPHEGEVLIRVMAAGVGPWDALIRTGRSAIAQSLPITLGTDLAGTVEALGPGESAFALGDDVFGATAGFIGAYAEYALVPSRMLAAKPLRLNYIDAASVPVVAVTACQMLEHAHVAREQRVLVHGAAGAVGAYAVQLAHMNGAHVIAAASAAHADYTRSLGADEVIDVHSDRFEDTTAPVDAVIDTVGGDIQRRSFAALKPGGSLVSVVSAPDEAESERRGVHSSWFLVDVNTLYLQRIAQLIDAGHLQTCVGTVLSLSEAREAHQMLSGSHPHPRGKIVLRVVTTSNSRPSAEARLRSSRIEHSNT